MSQPPAKKAKIEQGAAEPEIKGSSLDDLYRYDEESIQLALKEEPWAKTPKDPGFDAKFFKSVKVSALASMKMLKHAMAGVRDKEPGELSKEVMGLMVGKVHGDSILIMDVVPLPIKGEANFVEASDEIGVLQVQLQEAMEEKRRESFIGWYHSHPFDVSTHSMAFLSHTDVMTQSGFQQMVPQWLAIVIDPLRSIAKGRPIMGAFRCYQPAYTPPSNIDPEGNKVVDKEQATSRWGHSMARYYSLKVEFFMSSMGKAFMDILGANSLWIKNLSSSPLAETESSARFPERVKKADEELSKSSRTMGSMYAMPRRGHHGARDAQNQPMDQASSALCELATETCCGHVAQISKHLIFNVALGVKNRQAARLAAAKAQEQKS